MKAIVGGWAWLDRSQMTRKQENTLRKVLTLRPRKMHPKDEPKTLYLYEMTDTHLGVPREFFLQNQRFNNEVDFRLSEGRKDLWPGEEGLEFVGTLRESQQAAFDNVVATYRRGRIGGIVRAPTGWGKTVFACATIAELKVPTLVIVHNEMLLDQWLVRIKYGEEGVPPFLPNCEVGVIQGPKCEYRGKHIVVAMVQTLTSREFPPEIYQWPGFLVSDEVHRVGAPTWSQIPPRFNSRYRMGLSATPRRKDGLDNVFFWHIGPLIHAANQLQLKPLIKRVWTKFQVAQSRNMSQSLLNEATLLRFMQANPARNHLIVTKLIEALRAGRRVLVMSKRLKHLDTLDALFRTRWQDEVEEPMPAVGRCVGGISSEELEVVKRDAQLIFSTFQYTKEGFDVSSLDTLFLVMPASDVEQAVGRVLRLHPDKKEPIVVDFRDDRVELFRKWGHKRDVLYQRLCA